MFAASDRLPNIGGNTGKAAGKATDAFVLSATAERIIVGFPSNGIAHSQKPLKQSAAYPLACRGPTLHASLASTKARRNKPSPRPGRAQAGITICRHICFAMICASGADIAGAL